MKKKVLNIAIVFIGIMITFTIIANIFNKMTIINVSVEKLKSVNIFQEVETSAKVEAMNEEPLFIEEGLVINTIQVSEGQVVKKDTVLLQLDATHLGNRIREIEQEIYKIDLQIQEANAKQKEDEARYTQALNSAQETYNATVEEGNRQIAQAQSALEEAERKYNSFLNEYTEQGDGQDIEEGNDYAESLRKEKEEQLLGEIYQKSTEYQNAIAQSNRDEMTARQALEQAQIKPAFSSSVAQWESDKNILSEQLNKFKAIEAVQGNVLAPFDAVIVQLNIKSGDVVGTNAPILLANADSSMQLTCQFTADEMKIIGEDTNIIVNGVGKEGENKKIESLQIGTVTEQEESPETSLVSIQLPPDTYKIGTTVKVLARTKSKMYDMGIPIKALHQGDKDTYYVYIVSETKTFLGKKLEAKRVDVKLLEKDTEYAAIEFEAGLSDKQIIIEADKNINEGSRIRLLNI